MLSAAIRLELGVVKVTISGLLKRSKILLVLDIVRLLMIVVVPSLIFWGIVDITTTSTSFLPASWTMIFIGWLLPSIGSIGMEIRILQHWIVHHTTN
eukprot:scaffold3716_cov69-Cylindrotheca_fusiformis.AAC.36